MPGSGRARHRQAVQDLPDDQADDPLDLPGGHLGAPDLALRLGAHMPDLPRRPACLHRLQHPRGRVGNPGGIHGRGRRHLGGQGPGDHRRDVPPSAEHFDGLCLPGRSLLGQGARLVLGLPGLQGGLLGQFQ
jgi:hypothetical protein